MPLSFLRSQVAANLIGMLGSICFTIQYIPQAQLNYQRKSVKGFNKTGIIIKLIGACFLTVNAFLSGESVPVICYGLINVFQHSFFMFQFYLYETGGKNLYNLLWILFPIIPTFMGIAWPHSMTFTNGIKPLTQILSHLPQLMECARLRTTQGVSLVSQHLNAMGGLAGIYMLWVNPPVSSTTYLLYLNSIFQAVSLYALAIYFGECSFCRTHKWEATKVSELPVLTPSHQTTPPPIDAQLNGTSSSLYALPAIFCEHSSSLTP